MKCRHCHAEVTQRFADLGTAPPSNSYLSEKQLAGPERYYPLRVAVCSVCRLVQTEDFADREEFFSEDYGYFSSFSTQWLLHSEAYVKDMVARLGLDDRSLVVEVAANDGYLLQYVLAAGVGALGIEPTRSTADAARKKGIEIIEEFFGEELGARLAAEGRGADLTAANNVLAHVPDINDFVRGFARILKPAGVATFEFPHLVQLIEHHQFDTIYHEHYSYLSLTAVQRVFAANGLMVFDVQTLPTHGGSLRVFAQRSDTGAYEKTAALTDMLAREAALGIDTSEYYDGLQAHAERIKDDLISFLVQAKRDGKRVGAYGAAAKGNTLLNFAGVRGDLIDFVVDRNPHKQDKFMPGSRIPIVAEQHLRDAKPDYVVILPWNLRAELAEQLAYVREWGGKFVIAVPELLVE